MPDEKISQHPAAGAYVGTEPYSIVQGGSNKGGTPELQAAYCDQRSHVAVQLTHSVDQSIGNNAWEPLAFDTETYDPADLHNPADNTKVTIADSGIYVVTFSGRFASNATNRRGVRLLKGAGLLSEVLVGTAPGAQTSVTTSWCGRLLAAEVLSINVFQNSGGALDFEAARLYFNVALIVKG